MSDSGMVDIGTFLGTASGEFPDELAGKTGGGGFDGPPLNAKHEYRCVVDRAEWRKSQAGKWSYAITFRVIEDPDSDDEFLGRKFTEYYSIGKDTNRVGLEKFSKFIGQSGLDLAGLDQSDNQSFIDSFVDVEYVVAVRTWGSESDRTGVRWLNRNNGQALRTEVAAPKPKDGTQKPLDAEISVDKVKGPADETPTQAAEPEPQAPPVTLPTGNASSGISLPPGLAK